MIVSRKHQYIFLHCRKAAGSSIAVSLARDLGPDDLQLSGLRETAEAGIPFTRRVLREARDSAANAPRGRLLKQIDLAGLRGTRRKMQAIKKLVRAHYRPALGDPCQHAPAVRIRDAFPDDWQTFDKFCVVRNPWDKTVSDYYWRTRGNMAPPTFDRFVHAMAEGDPLDGIVPVAVIDNWPLYTIDDRIVANVVIRFENLSIELPKAMAQMGVPFDGWLPRAKGTHRPKTAQGDRHSLFTPQTRRIVENLFEKEIATFGYTF